MGRHIRWRYSGRGHAALAQLAGRRYRTWRNQYRGQQRADDSLGIGAGVWWVISSCIALGVGGYIASWLAGVEIRFDSVLHGLVTWALATLLTVYLLTSAVGGVLGSGFSTLGSFLPAAGSGVSQAAKPLAQAAGFTPELLQQQASIYLQPTQSDLASMSPQDAQKEIATNLPTYARGGPDAAAAKERIATIMATQLKISHDEAASKFNEVQNRLQEARDRAVQTAKNAADASAAAASKTAFAGFGVLLLGGIAAATGGSLAVQRRLLVTNRPLPERCETAS